METNPNISDPQRGKTQPAERKREATCKTIVLPLPQVREKIIYAFARGRSERSISIEYGRRDVISAVIQQDYIRLRKENAELRAESLREAVTRRIAA